MTGPRGRPRGRPRKIKDEDKICLEKGQIQNVIDAARADESGDISNVCPVALDYVRKAAPRIMTDEEKAKQDLKIELGLEKPTRLEKKVYRKIEKTFVNKMIEKFKHILPDTSGWF